MALLYDAAVPYDTPDYTYDGDAVGFVILTLRGFIADLTRLPGTIGDRSVVVGSV